MRIRIHRGAAEIGGSCIELEAASGARILLDLGMPLVEDADSLALPDVRGLASGDDPSLLGVVISHPHQDHWGKVGLAHPDVPVIIGRAAADILRAGLFFGTGIDLSPAAYLEHRRPLSLGPFTVTPYLNDHSAYDAYSLLVEAYGKRIFYTGDIRAHGPQGQALRPAHREPTAGRRRAPHGGHQRAARRGGAAPARHRSQARG